MVSTATKLNIKRIVWTSEEDKTFLKTWRTMFKIPKVALHWPVLKIIFYADVSDYAHGANLSKYINDVTYEQQIRTLRGIFARAQLKCSTIEKEAYAINILYSRKSMISKLVFAILHIRIIATSNFSIILIFNITKLCAGGVNVLRRRFQSLSSVSGVKLNHFACRIKSCLLRLIKNHYSNETT